MWNEKILPLLRSGKSHRQLRGPTDKLPPSHACIFFWFQRLTLACRIAPVITRLRHLLQFQVERFLVRGAAYRLAFIALMIVLISVAGGLLGAWVASDFRSPWEAVWWAFLRLTDAGYLGEDKGAGKRVVSVVLTLLGYVLFMGALIAIMTQWLQETITRLQSGLTPITRQNHFLILGWNDRTPTIVEQLLLSEGRVQRFLRMVGTSQLHIVILADDFIPTLVQQLRDHLGKLYKASQITLRHGSRLHLEHLRRVDFLHAAAILLPLEHSHGSSGVFSDGPTIKTLLSAATPEASAPTGPKPLMVAEILDARNIAIARHAYGGPIEILAGDSIISRIIAQTVRHAGLSRVFGELLSQKTGNQIFIREGHGLEGRAFHGLFDAFPKAVPIGVNRLQGQEHRPIMNPPGGCVLSAGDGLILVARAYEDTQPLTDLAADPIEWPPEAFITHPASNHPTRRILFLGWNSKAATLIREFDHYPSESFELDFLSLMPIARRQELLQRHESQPVRLRLRHFEGDYTAQSDLAKLKPETYDNIVLLASDRLESDAESEARILLGYLVLRDLLAQRGHSPEILVELMTAENIHMFQSGGNEVLVTPLLLSHLLTQVALLRDLNRVFEELFGPDGADFSFHPAGQFGLCKSEVTFREVQMAAAAHGETALGFRLYPPADPSGAGQVLLNPERDLARTLNEHDQIVVLTHGPSQGKTLQQGS